MNAVKPVALLKIAAEVSRSVKAPGLHERLSGLGAEVAGTTPAEFKSLFGRGIDKWAKVVSTARISLD